MIHRYGRSAGAILLAGLCFVFFINFQIAVAQEGSEPREPAALFAGDVAVIGFNTGPGSQISFVLLNNVTRGTIIRFTDNGWTDNLGLGQAEGMYTWTAPQDLCAGSVIVLERTTLDVEAGGDQILAFQRSVDGRLSFLYGINSVTNQVGWGVDGSSPDQSALPTGLVEGVSAISLGGPPFAVYGGPRTGSREEILEAIANQNNWLTAEDNPQFLSSQTFVITDGDPCKICDITQDQTYDFVGGFSAEIASLGRFVSLECIEVAFQPTRHPLAEEEIRFDLAPVHWRVTTEPANTIGFQAHITLDALRPVTEEDRLCQLIATAPVQWECVIPTSFFEEKLTVRNFSQFQDLSIGRPAGPVVESAPVPLDENPQVLTGFLVGSAFLILILFVALVWLMGHYRHPEH